MAVWYIPTSHSAPLSMWPFYELFQSSKMTSFLFSSGFFYLVDVYRMNKCFFSLHAFELFWKKKSLRIRPHKNDALKAPKRSLSLFGILPHLELRTFSTIFKIMVCPQISLGFYYVCYFVTLFICTVCQSFPSPYFRVPIPRLILTMSKFRVQFWVWFYKSLTSRPIPLYDGNKTLQNH